MNYPQRATLRVIGVLLFLFAFIFSVLSMPSSQDIRMADDICNLRIDIAGYKFQVGQFAQNVLDSKGECAKVHFLRLGIDYSWIVMVIGVVMFFTGVWAGLGARGKKEILG